MLAFPAALSSYENGGGLVITFRDVPEGNYSRRDA